MTSREIFLKHIGQTSETPLGLEISSAFGCWMYDTNGKKYLDLISGIAVSNLGHQNEAIKNAVVEQINKYMHLMVYGELIQSPQIQLAKYLTDLLPSELSSIYYTNSGSEAVEGAIKLAKKITGRTEIISFKHAYHGSTMGALSLGNDEERKNAFRPLIPDNTILDFNSFEQIKSITNRTAAVIIEPIQAEAGVILPKENYLESIRLRCIETNTILIFDECQTGFGRTGKLFAFEKYSFVPDILVIGKAFGGGMPLGAFISSKQNMDAFTNQPILGHLTTFGGQPVCCAASLAGLKELIEKNWMETVELKSQLFKKLLIHEKIVTCRIVGLFIAIELKNKETNFMLNKKCIEAGLFVDWFLFAPHCLRIAPPLIISEEEIEIACKTILHALNEIE